MITIIWDMELDANTMMLYVYTAAMMKQQHVPHIVG